MVSLGPLGVFAPVMYTLSSFSGEFPNYGHSGVSHYFGKTPHLSNEKTPVVQGM